MQNAVLPEPSPAMAAYFKMIDENPAWVASTKAQLKNDYAENGITPVSAKRYQGKREDNGEPFIDINDNWVHPQASRIKIMPRAFKQEMGLPEPELGSLMRIGTYHALLRTVAHLPAEIGLYVYEAYRPLERQRQLFALRVEKLKQEHADWTDEQVYRAVINLVCPVEEEVIPPHSTGGAVDIWMYDLRTGAILPMVKYSSGSVTTAPTFCTDITAEEQKNRDMLIDASIKGGTINFTGEIWHRSLGDAVWSTFTQQPACYKGVEGSEIKSKILRPADLVNIQPAVVSSINYSYGQSGKPASSQQPEKLHSKM